MELGHGGQQAMQPAEQETQHEMTGAGHQS